ncbi:transposase [Halobium palmae]|uniref:Transposase n=1 Tax=Halobium palmae TaxID=1776492 RepID=A0ABD5RUI6_9EURY
MDDRTNSYTAHFLSDEGKALFGAFGSSSCACYNQINYTRWEAYLDPDEDVFEVDIRYLREEYVPVIGSGTFDQLARKNRMMWSSFFDLKAKYNNPSNTTVTDRPSPPGYWGNRREGYPLRTIIRNDLYTLDWREGRSYLEFTIGDALKEKYGYGGNEKFRVEVRGEPRWEGKDGWVIIWFDEDRNELCVRQTVKQPTLTDRAQSSRSDQTHTPLRNTQLDISTEPATTAAVDIGANNTATIVTDTGTALVFDARTDFEHFHHLTTQISDAQSELPGGVYTSERIRRLYALRGRRRDHHRDSVVRFVVEWLVACGVEEFIIGDLTDVLSTYWNAVVNEKTHAFWTHRQLIERFEQVCEEFDLTLREESEAGTSSMCPMCQADGNDISRDRDVFDCLMCEWRGHADIVGGINLLTNTTDTTVEQWHSDREDERSYGSMARPAAPFPVRDGDAHPNVAYLKWNDHRWIPSHRGREREQRDHRQRVAVGTNEDSVNP